MKVYRSLAEFIPLKKAIVTVGTFDGVHVGHRKILQRLKQKATELNGETVVITFWPHPRLIVSPENDPVKLLSTLKEKIHLLEDVGIDHLLIMPFTRELSEMSKETYVQKILIKGIGLHTLVIGYDHRFGKNREGGFDYLKENQGRFKIEIEEISRQEIEHLTISSTKIRNALLIGEVGVANELLGRSYSFSGLVKKGRQLGRTIGFPTANVHVEKNYKLIPSKGVYAVNVILRGKEFMGIMNIGQRPTVQGKGITQEVHILDFDDDIYGENLTIKVVQFIRTEQKFPELSDLIAQIEKDCSKAREILTN